ncbi:alpha-crystallin A chain-like [Plutella xylostella]|uniref:Hsp20 n=1 Tax=Plutella xylostella TaxID=51655 RepID=U6BMM6_PLUXY|nr:alpha-crystallin A chain-like [Plutella xylostella]AHA36865.1 Hsp20 [Plutella xylostella]
MSLLPYFYDYDFQFPRRAFDQSFGHGLAPELLMAASPLRHRLPYWPRLPADVGSSIKTDKDSFQVNIDVQHFAPEEIAVKTADGFIVVEGKHEERKDEHGFISRQFVRKFKLPEGCDLEAVQSKLSSDGVLSVVAPKKVEAVKGERSVPISHTGPVRKEVKEDLTVEPKDEGKK